MTLLECPPIPLLLGVVLRPMSGENFRCALSIANGDDLAFMQSPICATLLFIAVLSMIFVETQRNAQSATMHWRNKDTP